MMGKMGKNRTVMIKQGKSRRNQGEMTEGERQNNRGGES